MLGALGPVLVSLLKLLQILVQSIGQQDLSASTLSPLHLHDHLASGHLDLLLLHALPPLLHLVDFLFVATLFSLPLLPLFVSNACHDLHTLFGLFLLFVDASLLVVFDLLLVSLTLLLHQALLQPVFECLVALFLLNLLVQALGFLLSEQLLLLEGLADKLLFFPLVHAMRPLLVLLVQGRLFHDHLLEQVFFGLEDEDFAQALLMLLDAEPLVMLDLSLGDFLLTLAMHL